MTGGKLGKWMREDEINWIVEYKASLLRTGGKTWTEFCYQPIWLLEVTQQCGQVKLYLEVDPHHSCSCFSTGRNCCVAGQGAIDVQQEPRESFN